MDDHTVERQTEAEYVERVFARGLVVAGGLFWMVAAFAGPYVYEGMSLSASIQTALWPFFTAAVILAVGWTYERLAAVLLLGASAAVLVWGVLYSWELGVWIIMAFVLIAPMLASAVMYLLAARSEMRRIATEQARRPVAIRPVPKRTQAQVRPR